MQLFPTGETVFSDDSIILRVGNAAFSFGDADFNSSDQFRWSNSGLSWSDGDTVTVRLVAVPSPATLVANDGQSRRTGGAQVSPGTNPYLQAQRFKTGDSEDGYVLTSVALYVLAYNAGDELAVSIHTDNGSARPDTLLHELTSPTLTATEGFYTFEAAPGARLGSGTQYHVVVEGTVGTLRVGLTDMDAEDAGVSCGPMVGLSPSDVVVSGVRLTLRYGAELDAGSVPSPIDFAVVAASAGATVPVPVTAVSVRGSEAVLTLSRAVGPAEAVSLSYLAAAMHTLPDASLNAVLPLTDRTVRRATAAPADDAPVDPPPETAPGTLAGTAPGVAAKTERLDLSSRGLVDISVLAGLPDLERLDLRGNAVANLGLADNRVADVGLLRELRSLRRLNLSGNRLRHVSVLGDLSDLVWLRLAGNPVADVSSLGRLTALRWLWLDAGTSRADGAALRVRPEVAPVLVIGWPGREPAPEAVELRRPGT